MTRAATGTRLGGMALLALGAALLVVLPAGFRAHYPHAASVVGPAYKALGGLCVGAAVGPVVPGWAVAVAAVALAVGAAVAGYQREERREHFDT